MLILGIDPGLQRTGYGVIDANKKGFRLEAAGFIKTSRCDGLPKRLFTLYSGVSKIIDQYKPETLVLEKLYAHYKHPLTASLLGHARGVICMLAEEKRIAFFEYPATRVKKIATGSGHASKHQIQRMMEHTFGPQKTFRSQDTTDAIALAITHAYLARVKI